jgi:hypothetical protein
MDIELADAVAVVREELLEAAGRGSDQPVAFAVGPIELEFAIELRADAKAKAGFKAWVITGNVESGLAKALIHRVKVILTPKQSDGGDLLISAGRGEPAGDSGHLGR